MNASWRTTSAGVAVVLAALFAWLNKRYHMDLPVDSDTLAMLAGLIVGIGLCVARDNKVTSEQAGAPAAGKDKAP